jgi:hypothetical protein
MRCLYSPAAKRVNGHDASMTWFICINLRSSAANCLFYDLRGAP